jgi:hypothetical protein
MSIGDKEDDQYGSSDFEQDSNSSLLEAEKSPPENAASDTTANYRSNPGSEYERAVFGVRIEDCKQASESVEMQKCLKSTANVQTEKMASGLYEKPSVDASTYSVPTNSEHAALNQPRTYMNRRLLVESEMPYISPMALNRRRVDKAESMESCSPCSSTVASSESFISSWNCGVTEKNTWVKDLTTNMDDSKSWFEQDKGNEEKDAVGFSRDAKFDPFPLLADLKRTIKEIQAEIPDSDDGTRQENANTPLHIEGAIIEAKDLPFNRIIGGNTFVRVLYVSPGPGHMMSRSKKNLHQTNLAASSPHPSWNSQFSSICSGKPKGDLIFALYTVINNENYFIGQVSYFFQRLFAFLQLDRVLLKLLSQSGSGKN